MTRELPFKPSKVYDYDPRNLPPRLLQAIGLGVASAAQTANLIEAAIWGCMGINVEYGMAVTTHMPDPLRFSVLRSVAEITIDDVDSLDELDEILANVQMALNKRNAFAHQSWCRDPDAGELFTDKIDARSRLEADRIPRTIDQVERESLAIYDAGIRLMTFLMKMNLLAPIPPLRPRGHKSKRARKILREKKNN